MSLYETARYFSYRIGQRARATSILTRAFLMCLLAYTVTHAVGLVVNQLQDPPLADCLHYT